MPELTAVFNTAQAIANQREFIAGFDGIADAAQRSGGIVDQAFDDTGGLDDFDDGLRRSSDSSGVLAGSLRTLSAVALGYLSIETATAVYDLADSFNEVQNRVRSVTPELEDVDGVVGALADVARDTGVRFEDVASTFQRFSIATSELGVSQERVIELVGILNTGLVSFGATSAEAASVSLQLAQGFASGVLQGDELKSILEGFPPLTQAIAEELGISADKVKEFGTDGKISAEVVLGAMDRLGNTVDELGESIEVTTDRSFNSFRTSLIEITGNIDEVAGVTSTVSNAFQNAAENLAKLNDFLFDGNDAAEDLTETVERTGPEVTSLAEDFQFLVGIGQSVLRAIEPIIDAFGDALTDAFDDARQAIDDVTAGVAPLVRGFQSVTDVVGTTLTNAVNSAREGLSDFLDLLPEGIRNFAGFGEQADEAADALEELGEAADDVERDVDDLIDSNDELFGSLEDSTAAAGDAANSIFAIGLASQSASADVGLFGVTFGETFDNASRDAADLSDAVLDATDDIIDNLEAVGIEIESIFGERASRAIDGFFGLIRSNTGVASNLFGDFLGLLGGGTADAAEQATSGYFGFAESVGSSIPDLTEQVGGLTGGFGELSAVLGNLGAAAGALGALGQATFEISKLLGFDDGTATGAAIGNVIFPGLGGFIGGGIGALVGAGGNEERGQARDFQEQFRQFFAAGGSATSGDIISQIGDMDVARETLQRLQAEFDLLNNAFDSVTTKFGELNVDSRFVLRALADQAGTAAGIISEEFGISAVDVAAAINSLPPDVRQSFDSLSENSDQVAELLAERFGISVEEVKALLGELAILGDEALRNVGSASDSAAISLANAFGVSVAEAQAVLALLPPSATDSFESIRANSDTIAAQIAGAFGVSVEEVKAILGDLGVVGQQELERVATGAETATANIGESFAATGLNIDAILAAIAEQGTASFGEIAQNADGSFSLVDVSAQERLANIVTAFGGTQADVQAILEILGQNGIDAFDQIAIGADGSFEVIRLAGSESLEAVVQEFAGTRDATGVLLEAMGADGVDAFGVIADGADGAFVRINDVSQETLQDIQAEFADSEGTISDLFEILAANGAISFGELGDAGLVSAEDIAAAFEAAGGDAASALEILEGEGATVFAAVESSGVGAASGVEVAFVGASDTIRASINSIISEAARARDAVNSIPAVPAVPGAAFGGLITEPVRLSSSQPFGQSGFASGGILPGLTAIGGGSGLFHAVAGEGGRPEAIVPLEQTSRGLGINATGIGGNSLTQVIIIEGVDRAETDRIKQRMAAINSSVETRATRAAANLLLGRA